MSELQQTILGQISFRKEVGEEMWELKLVPNQKQQCLDLWKFISWKIGEPKPENIGWIFLGSVDMGNLITIVNRKSLTCKYGHSLTVEKRKQKRKKGEQKT